ncbi:MAG: TusE/DsrC/DsvC family sulfur relay protein [Nitrospinae bacterium]|nr:TusE/DsrC/DsvC family sulfur relay protein [Nitrospinota bacterium]
MSEHIEVGNKKIDVDEDGFIQKWEDWSKDIADYLAKTEGVNEMSKEHWVVVNYLREYYTQYKIAPMIRLLLKETGKRLGQEKAVSNKYLYELFPSGPAKGACKIAGLPKPTGCV